MCEHEFRALARDMEAIGTGEMGSYREHRAMMRSIVLVNGCNGKKTDP